MSNEAGFFVDIDENGDSAGTIEIAEDGSVVHSSVEFVSEELNEEEARALTDSIRSTGDLLYTLIARAHRGKAYIALGYNSFEEYIKTEFNMSRSRAYQLLNLSAVTKELESALPKGVDISITEAQARDIKDILPGVIERVKEKISSRDDEAGEIFDEIGDEEKEDISAIVSETIEEAREEKKHPKDDTDGSYHEGDKGSNYDGENYGGGNYGGGDGSFYGDGEDGLNPSVNNVDYALNQKYDDDDDDMTYKGDSGITQKPTLNTTVAEEDVLEFVEFIGTFKDKFATPQALLGEMSPAQRKAVNSRLLDVSDYINEMLDHLAIGDMSKP